jgi:hypothetical protein
MNNPNSIITIGEISGSETDNEYEHKNINKNENGTQCVNQILANTNTTAASMGCEVSRLHKTIDDLMVKYEGRDAVLSKLSALILQIPTALSNYEITLQERSERKSALSTTADEFIEQFLTDDSNKYYYNSAIDLFFAYNRNTMKYELTEEDEIAQVTLLALNEYDELKPWKYRIKNQIIKRIKEEKELLNSTPESHTIQKVISLFVPSVFKTRDAAKHFLIVLGDIYYKKNVNIYFVTSKAKRFIKELSSECSALFGMHGMNNVFKFKFYEHTFSECRLIDMNDSGLSNVNVCEYSSPFKRNIVEIMCVACCYSKRFKNADSFLDSQYCKDPVLHSHCLYLKLNDEDAIIKRFIATATTPCNNSQYFITWKKMHFLWKIFLDDERLPYIIFTNHLKNRLMSILPHQIVTTSANMLPTLIIEKEKEKEKENEKDIDKDKESLDGGDVIFTSVTSKNTNLNLDLQNSHCGIDMFSE